MYISLISAFLSSSGMTKTGAVEVILPKTSLCPTTLCKWMPTKPNSLPTLEQFKMPMCMISPGFPVLRGKSGSRIDKPWLVTLYGCVSVSKHTISPEYLKAAAEVAKGPQW